MFLYQILKYSTYLYRSFANCKTQIYLLMSCNVNSKLNVLLMKLHHSQTES